MLSKAGLHSPLTATRSLANRPTTASAVIFTLALLIFLIFFHLDAATPPTDVLPRLPTISHDRSDHAQYPRIAKVSMLYGRAPHHYVRALRSHRAHNERFNYAMYTLQEDAVGGYWNKPTYLLSIVMQELAKPMAERLEWVMWVDADLVLINPSVPLETFLPPESSNVKFLGNRDQNGLNTGTFFLRVSPWSVKFLTKALALPIFAPDKLGYHADQEAMAMILRDSKSSMGEILFQPRTWYNTYEMDIGFEGGDPANGHMLVHFPGLEDRRWRLMERWLDRIEKTQGRYDVPLNESIYVDQVNDFWKLQTQAEGLLRQSHALMPGDEAALSEEGRKVAGLANGLVDLIQGPKASTGPGTDLLALLGEQIGKLTDALRSAERAAKKAAESQATSVELSKHTLTSRPTPAAKVSAKDVEHNEQAKT